MFLELDVVAHNSSTQEVGVVGSVQGYPWLQNELVSGLGYMKPCLKKYKSERKKELETGKSSGRPSFVSNWETQNRQEAT